MFFNFSYNVLILSQISKAVIMFARVPNMSAGGIMLDNNTYNL